MAGQRGLLGNVVRSVGMPPEHDGERDLMDDQADGQGRGDASQARARSPRRRRPPVTEKGKGRNLKIPDTVFRRLDLEARRRGIDMSRLVTQILDRDLPADIRIVVGDEKVPAPE
jgi:hypothetical protein